MKSRESLTQFQYHSVMEIERLLDEIRSIIAEQEYYVPITHELDQIAQELVKIKIGTERKWRKSTAVQRVVEWKGDYIVGGAGRTFRFIQTPTRKGFKYVWVNMPEDFKRVLKPRQYLIKPTIKGMTAEELLHEVMESYEAYHEELKHLKNQNEKNWKVT